MFIKLNNKIINAETIDWIDYEPLIREGYIKVFAGFTEIVKGNEAFDLVMRLCPEAIEGARAKHAWQAWAIHNLIGHPLMQILSWIGLTKLGLKIHDATVPMPLKNTNE